MGALTIAITGASGFLGKACVTAALERGHRVRALVRCEDASLPETVDIVICDLADGLPADALLGVDAVIHIAAAMSNDPAILARDTTQATAKLVDAIKHDASHARLVLASSIAVYDAFGTVENGTVDESTPLETDLVKREGYTRAKLVQERQTQDANLSTWALRIGALYDDTRLWNAHIGPRLGSVLFSLSRSGQAPICHVQNAADALVLAAETEPKGAFETLNIVEDTLPTRAEFIAQVHNGLHVKLSWRLLMPLATFTEAIVGARAPGLLRPRVLAARMRPVRYSNELAKRQLGWVPSARFGSATSKTKGRPL